MQSWIREWNAMGERVERRGDVSQQNNHLVSAGESYLRCYTYYRVPLLFINPIKEPQRFAQQYEKVRICFRKAIKFFNTPVESVEIPYQDHTLPGYFFKPNEEKAPRKTLLLIGGGDTFVEDLYSYMVPAALKRDYNIFIVDLPGQGMLPFEGLVWPRESEKSVSTVVDYLLQRQNVDAERLAIYGLSGGGHLVPRALTAEKRIKAGVTCAAILDFSAVWNRKLVNLVRRAKSLFIYKLLNAYVSRKRRAYYTMVDTYVWRIGCQSADKLIKDTRGYTVDPEKITCPFLNIVAQQEYDQSSHMKKAAQAIEEKSPHQKNKTVIMSANEGADSHGIGTNLALLSQVTFDWLDDIFDRD